MLVTMVKHKTISNSLKSPYSLCESSGSINVQIILL